MVLRIAIVLVLYVTILPTRAQWQVKVGASQVSARDPIGLAHGSRTGRGVYGVGYHVGVGYGYRWSESFGLRGEMLLDMRNCGYEIRNQDLPFSLPGTEYVFSNGDRIMELTHVVAPLLVSFHRWPRLRVDGGLSGAYLLRARETIHGQLLELNADRRVRKAVDRTSQLAPVELALVLGAEVDSGRRLGMGVRFHYGLSDIDARMGGSPSYLRTWHVSFSYSFLERDPG